jgi:hypothetical protein
MGLAGWGFAGALDENGTATVTVKRGNLNPLTIQLTVSQDAENVSGSISDGTWTAAMTGYRAVFVGTSTASDQMGRYTMVIPSPSNTGLGGTSYGVLNVAKNGRLTYTGNWADGTHVMQSTFVSRNGQWPLYVPVYGGKGYLFSWMNFSSTAVSGQINWDKPLDNGFSTVASASGSPYVPAIGGNAILNFSDGQVALNGGNLDQSLQDEIWLHPNGHVTNLGDLKVNITFSPATGAFNGTVIDPDTKRALPVHGVAVQQQNLASGYFLGGGQSGQVIVKP